MNGWILSPPPSFSLTFQASLLLSSSLSPFLSNFLTLFSPQFLTLCLFLSLTLQPPTLTVLFYCHLPLPPTFFSSFSPSCPHTNSVHSPSSLPKLFERVFSNNGHSVSFKPVSIVRGGPLVLFAIPTLTCHTDFHYTGHLSLSPSFSISAASFFSLLKL